MTDFNLPELGENITAGDVLRVLVQPGDIVAKDQPVLELDNATLQFVEATDGRGEGLAGLYLAPGSEPALPLELEICGMRITVEGASPA